MVEYMDKTNNKGREKEKKRKKKSINRILKIKKERMEKNIKA